ncbi:MAG: hypothetical protein V3R34_04290 [Hyphomicrobium sp.]|nr:hypothetical protein [Hyphomicrobiaceae bacterium]MCK5713937.1 hypothetical protein [Hyphomicrobiaceae bacterium]
MKAAWGFASEAFALLPVAHLRNDPASQGMLPVSFDGARWRLDCPSFGPGHVAGACFGLMTWVRSKVGAERER